MLSSSMVWITSKYFFLPEQLSCCFLGYDVGVGVVGNIFVIFDFLLKQTGYTPIIRYIASVVNPNLFFIL